MEDWVGYKFDNTAPQAGNKYTIYRLLVMDAPSVAGIVHEGLDSK